MMNESERQMASRVAAKGGIIGALRVGNHLYLLNIQYLSGDYPC